MTYNLQKYKNLELALADCGEYVTQVRGMSMYPMLRTQRDPILIHSLKTELKPYDIAVYAKNNNYVVHRVLETRNDCYVIRGDNCTGKEYIPKQDVIGIVVGFWRVSGTVPQTHFIDTNNHWYKLYARLWVAINPLLRLLHSTKALAHTFLKL